MMSANTRGTFATGEGASLVSSEYLDDRKKSFVFVHIAVFWKYWKKPSKIIEFPFCLCYNYCVL